MIIFFCFLFSKIGKYPYQPPLFCGRKNIIFSILKNFVIVKEHKYRRNPVFKPFFICDKNLIFVIKIIKWLVCLTFINTYLFKIIHFQIFLIFF